MNPPHETVSDNKSSLHWSMSSMRAHSKWSAELGQVFRQGVPSDELTPHMKLSVTADQVFTDLCLQWEPIQNGSRIRSSFQTRCTLRWADPPHETVSDSRSSSSLIYVFNESPFKMVAELGQVFRQGVPSDELTPHMKPVSDSRSSLPLIYVCNESPFKTVIFITALHCVKL